MDESSEEGEEGEEGEGEEAAAIQRGELVDVDLLNRDTALLLSNVT